MNRRFPGFPVARATTVVLVALTLVACDPDEKNATESPEPPPSAQPNAESRGSAQLAETSSPEQTAAPQAKESTPVPQTPTDRDPEEEKRKMDASLKISAAAVRALEQGRSDEAVAGARDALKIHEQNVEAMLVIAEAFYKRGRYELTLSVTNSALSVDPAVLRPEDASQAHNLKGFAQLAANQRQAAMKSFRAAADTDPNNASAWNNIGVQYMWLGDVATAMSCFKYATDLSQNFFGAWLNYGAALRAQGQIPEALRAFEKAAQLRPNDPRPQFNLGVLYLDAEQIGDADAATRLNKSIAALTRYKELLMQGTGSPQLEQGPGRKKGAYGNELVTVAQADLYVEAAKKGLEREARRQEREKEREERREKEEAEAAARAAEEAAAAAANPEPAPTPVEGAPPPQAPGGPTPQPATPEEPGTESESPSPAPQPQAPTPEAPKPQAPKPQAPKPQAPGPAPDQPSSPPPEAAKPQAPKPQAPKPQAPKPQAPKPQSPTPQKPGG